MAKSELIKDLEKLAKQVFELSVKHGDIYINASRCKDSGHSSVDYGSSPIKSVNYWSKDKRFDTL